MFPCFVFPRLRSRLRRTYKSTLNPFPLPLVVPMLKLCAALCLDYLLFPPHISSYIHTLRITPVGTSFAEWLRVPWKSIISYPGFLLPCVCGGLLPIFPHFTLHIPNGHIFWYDIRLTFWYAVWHAVYLKFIWHMHDFLATHIPTFSLTYSDWDVACHNFDIFDIYQYT